MSAVTNLGLYRDNTAAYVEHHHGVLPAGCYELYAMLCGERRSFWQESRLCVLDLGARVAQRLSAGVPPGLAQHGKECMPQGADASEVYTERLHAERWQSCDLDMQAVT